MTRLEVKRSIEIKAPAAKVWQIITSPSAMKRWMLVEPKVDESRPLGLKSKIRWTDERGKPYLAGLVVRFETGRRLVLELADVSWRRRAKAGEVTYALSLSTAGSTTRVRFSLGDLSIDPAARAWYEAYSNSRELESIKEMAESG